MTEAEHCRRLEAMYGAAPINRFFRSRIRISHGQARIEMDMRPDYFHAAGAAHGAVYFKLLDDAGFFAVASLVTDVFVLTTGFNIHLTRPIGAGRMVAQARWLHGHRRVFLAEGVLYDG
ncbi:MAG: PaaI family thioesterase, partial [Alphaproteobacteria bacterium]